MGTASNNTGGDLCCQDSPKGIGPVTCDVVNTKLAFGLLADLQTTRNDIMNKLDNTNIVDDISSIGTWAEKMAMPKCRDTGL